MPVPMKASPIFARFIALPLFLLLLLPTTTAAAAAGGAGEGDTYEVRYHHILTNHTAAPLTDVIVYLPVPQNDEYQQVSDFRVERERQVHISNRTDAYGTKIKRVAIARLEPGESINVGFSCIVTLNPPARIALGETRKGKPGGASLDEIPQDIRDKFLVDQRIFGLATPIIKQAAEQLMRDHPDPVQRARAIHDLIAGTFDYKGGDGWDAAPDVLARKSGSCSEFAYVFCALCRATGIPTRFVGGSIFPLKSKSPFTDKGWHRWAEAYLPGLGWVPFDPTLDRARRPKQDFVGTHHPRVLILTRIGSKSLQLGLSYIGANSHTDQTKRVRHFVWTDDLRQQVSEARTLLEAGRIEEGHAALKQLMDQHPGSRAAEEAQRLLAPPAPPVATAALPPPPSGPAEPATQPE